MATARRSARSRCAARGSPAPTTATTTPRSSTTAGCAPATSARSTRRATSAHRPGQGRHQVRRRVDLLGRARERADGPPRRRSRPPSSASRTSGGRSGRSPCVVRRDGASIAGRRSCGVPGGQRCAAGGCRSGGRSSTRCRRPASASSTRRCCGPSTPPVSSRSRSSCPRPIEAARAYGVGVTVGSGSGWVANSGRSGLAITATAPSLAGARVSRCPQPSRPPRAR